MQSCCGCFRVDHCPSNIHCAYLGRIHLHNCMCCCTVIEVADQTCHLIQSQHTDTRPTSCSTEPTRLGTWQGSHWRPVFKSLVWLHLEKNPQLKLESNPDLPVSGQTSYHQAHEVVHCFRDPGQPQLPRGEVSALKTGDTRTVTHFACASHTVDLNTGTLEDTLSLTWVKGSG